MGQEIKRCYIGWLASWHFERCETWIKDKENVGMTRGVSILVGSALLGKTAARGGVGVGGPSRPRMYGVAGLMGLGIEMGRHTSVSDRVSRICPMASASGRVRGNRLHDQDCGVLVSAPSVLGWRRTVEAWSCADSDVSALSHRMYEVRSTTLERFGDWIVIVARIRVPWFKAATGLDWKFVVVVGVKTRSEWRPMTSGSERYS